LRLFEGLAVSAIEGLRAFLSLKPKALVSASFCLSSWLLRVDVLVGDLLKARSRSSGFDRAMLAFVGAWKDDRGGERRCDAILGGRGSICEIAARQQKLVSCCRLFALYVRQPLLQFSTR
jgi:hypothetical protein